MPWPAAAGVFNSLHKGRSFCQAAMRVHFCSTKNRTSMRSAICEHQPDTDFLSARIHSIITNYSAVIS